MGHSPTTLIKELSGGSWCALTYPLMSQTTVGNTAAIHSPAQLQHELFTSEGFSDELDDICGCLAELCYAAAWPCRGNSGWQAQSRSGRVPIAVAKELL